MTSGITGLILAGGRSRRMGRDKAWLPWGPTTLIERTLEVLRPIMDEVIVVVSEAGPFRRLPVRVVEDEVPGAHALGGLYTGLRSATTNLCFACGCDAPFLQPAVIHALRDLADGYDGVIPCDAGRLHPLHAIYRTTITPVVSAQLCAARWDVAALAGRVRTRVVDVDALACGADARLSLFNVNTPADYARALALNTSRVGSVPVGGQLRSAEVLGASQHGKRLS